MPFPLPRDPDFIKEIVISWIFDVGDRLCLDDPDGAEKSLQIAQSLYLSLPAGKGDDSLEKMILLARVKIEQHSQKKKPNANSI